MGRGGGVEAEEGGGGGWSDGWLLHFSACINLYTCIETRERVRYVNNFHSK